MTQRTTSTISGLPGTPGGMTVEQTLSQVWKETVEDVAADGTTTLRATFETIDIDMSTPIGRMAYDTAHPEAASDQATCRRTPQRHWPAFALASTLLLRQDSSTPGTGPDGTAMNMRSVSVSTTTLELLRP